MIASKTVEQAIKVTAEDKDKLLFVHFEKQPDLQVAQQIPRADARSTPAVSFPGAKPDTTYLVACLDLDAPYVSASFLGPILHWIQPNVKLAESQPEGRTGALDFAGQPFIAEYIGPDPPPPSGAHRYLFLLYEQPSDLDVSKFTTKDGKPFGLVGRIRTDWTAWEKKLNLGQVIAQTYFKSV